MQLSLYIFIAIAVFRHTGTQIQSCPLGYAVLVPCCATSKDLSSSTSQVYCPSGCMSKNLSVWGTENYTENTAVCLAAIHAGKVSNGGGYITVQKLPGQEMYTGSTMNGIISLNYGISATSFTILGYSTQTVTSTISPITTTTTATTADTTTTAATTSTTTTSAAATTTTSNPTSTIVTSTPATVGTSTMATSTTFATSPVTSATTTLTTPQTSLTSTTIPMSSTQTSIATTASTATTATTITAVNIGKVDCYTYLDMLTGDPLLMLCPPNCNSSYLVYGTDIYTSDSDLCPSAIHAGATTANGGYVTVKRQPLQDTYIGSYRNGIKSLSTTSMLVMESYIFV